MQTLATNLFILKSYVIIMSLDALTEIVSNIPLNDTFVYKSCYPYIVGLSIPFDAKTNEMRTNIFDPLYARYRADKLKVHFIVDRSTYTYVDNVHNTIYPNKRLQYTVGEIIQSDDYDDNIEAIRTKGIHFFKSLECAYYYEINTSQYTGILKKWSCDGKLQSIHTYENGTCLD